METRDLFGVWISKILYRFRMDGYGCVWILVGSIFQGLVMNSS